MPSDGPADETAAEETAQPPLTQDHVDILCDISPHVLTLFAAHECEKRVPADERLTISDIRHQINAWLSGHRDYQPIRYSVHRLADDFEFIDMQQFGDTQGNDCRLTPEGRRFLQAFCVDQAFENATFTDDGENTD